MSSDREARHGSYPAVIVPPPTTTTTTAPNQTSLASRKSQTPSSARRFGKHSISFSHNIQCATPSAPYAL